ncbi:MAG: hypothetical protein PHE27_03595 [Alphaproteobacteria bacterium]|nr:hypothetical protein [Alphaproteobacteria bacterium]
MSTTTPGVVFSDTTPLSSLKLSVRLDENVTNQKSYDSTDLGATLGYSKKNSRWSVSTNHAATYDTTRSSEESSYDNSSSIARHTGVTSSLSIGYMPLPGNTVSIAGSGNLSRYDSSLLQNYNTYSASASFGYEFDEFNTAVLSVPFNRYETSRNDASRSDTFSPSLGWTRIFSERLTGNASAGVQANKQYAYGTVVSDWSWNYVFDGGLTYRAEQDSIVLRAVRSQNANGNGQDALQTSVSLKGQHNVNPSFTLTYAANHRNSSYEVYSAGSSEVLSGGSVGLSYHATDCLDITTQYAYRYETFVAESTNAEDHAVTIGLAYHPVEWDL